MILELVQQKPIDGSVCIRCGMLTRLVGIESHLVMPDWSILTFCCPGCASTHANAVSAKEAYDAR